MSASLLLLLIAAAAAVGLYRRRGRVGLRQALTQTGTSLGQVLPPLLLALPMASLLAELIPPSAVAPWIGPQSGLAGIALAAVLGGLMPGGPFVTFPLVLAFAKAGAGTAQMAALLSGWSVFAVQRILSWEYPLLGWRFVLIRLVAGFPLPFLAGILVESLGMAILGAFGTR